MSNKELYDRFIEYKKKNKKITYRFLADKLGTSSNNIGDKFNHLRQGKSVNTKFLIDIENIIGEPIFFGNYIR